MMFDLDCLERECGYFSQTRRASIGFMGAPKMCKNEGLSIQTHCYGAQGQNRPFLVSFQFIKLFGKSLNMRTIFTMSPASYGCGRLVISQVGGMESAIIPA